MCMHVYYDIVSMYCAAFVWDSNRCHASVRLSNGNCTASVGDNAHWICAGGSKVLENGRHYWELQLDRYGIPSPNKKIVAGIVHATGLDPHCWQRNRTIIGLYYSPFNTQSWSLALQTGRKLSQFTRSRSVYPHHVIPLAQACWRLTSVLWCLNSSHSHCPNLLSPSGLPTMGSMG